MLYPCLVELDVIVKLRTTYAALRRILYAAVAISPTVIYIKQATKWNTSILSKYTDTILFFNQSLLGSWIFLCWIFWCKSVVYLNFAVISAMLCNCANYCTGNPQIDNKAWVEVDGSCEDEHISLQVHSHLYLYENCSRKLLSYNCLYFCKKINSFLSECLQYFNP